MSQSDLFLYNLAVVAIMKDETPYVQEWLNYHLLAGVEHFYIYDNESQEDFHEVLRPYIDADLVTYIPFPGKSPQFPAYSDAVKKFRFFSRYIAFIDCDEFIYPISGQSIPDFTDNIFRQHPHAGALAMSWHCFGSGGQEKADYSRGVLERFLYRGAPNNANCPDGILKNIANPRRLDYFHCPHALNHFHGYYSVNEAGTPLYSMRNEPGNDQNIVVNHYQVKSLEEFLKKNQRGDVVYNDVNFTVEKFREADNNEIFDDGILQYRSARQRLLNIADTSDILPYFAVQNAVNYEELAISIKQRLNQQILKITPVAKFADELETYLTYRALVANEIVSSFLGDEAECFSELALQGIHKSLLVGALKPAEIYLLISELPSILPLKFPLVQDIRLMSIMFIDSMLTYYRENYNSSDNIITWNRYCRLGEIKKMLQVWDK